MFSSWGVVSNLTLDNDSRIAVIGGGPAGSFFSYFLLDMAGRADIRVHLDIYDPKDFSRQGPSGCNMCGGIVSESLVQMLAIEGINLPPAVVQRGIDSYVLHTDVGMVRIDTPLHEKRIAAVHRGGGPRGANGMHWQSFDGYLQGLAAGKGAHVIHRRIDEVRWQRGRPLVATGEGRPELYDLIVVAVGVNSAAMKFFEQLGIGYRPPETTRTYICEFALGTERVNQYFGNSMHVFLLDIPRLKFAALIPKGEFVTMCLLGHAVDNDLIQSFLSAPEVKECLPRDWEMPREFCHCSPFINIGGTDKPFGDRIVFIGDSGVSRLYKDGIGAAYRTAKAAAKTAVFEGISERDFRTSYLPACRMIARDNRIGRFIFVLTNLLQKVRCARRGVLRMIAGEQQKAGVCRHMSTVLWDTFTGSAPYRDIVMRALKPACWGRLFLDTVMSLPLFRHSVDQGRHQ